MTTDPIAALDAGLAGNETMRVNAALLALALDRDDELALQLRLMLDLEIRDGRVPAGGAFEHALRGLPDAVVAAAARRVPAGAFERAVAAASRAAAGTPCSDPWAP